MIPKTVGKLANSTWFLINQQVDGSANQTSTTSALQIFGFGVILKVSTRQANNTPPGLPDMGYSSLAESLIAIPGASLRHGPGGITEIIF